MFTGIIQQLGKIKTIKGSRFVISHNFTEALEIGESVALNGMCSTVVEFSDKDLAVDIMAESRSVTTFGTAQAGTLVNLERSAKMGERNSGHNVTGHVDQVGEIVKIKPLSDFYLIRVKFNPENRKFLVHKGSVALEGISLTISGLGDDFFEVSIIPHTWQHTNLYDKIEGDGVNLEFDIFGKYVLNLK